MILGVGIDIIEVRRIQASYEKFGDRFLKRILHDNEIAYCLSHKVPGPFLAARFAAKEAISKAFGTGIGAKLANAVGPNQLRFLLIAMIAAMALFMALKAWR